MDEKNKKQLIERWWKVRGKCDSDEHMLTVIFMEIQTNPEMGEALVEGLEDRMRD